MGNIDLTNKIERLKSSEEQFGVALNSISAFLEEIDSISYYLNVRGELTSRNGMILKDDVELVAAAYDLSARVIGTSSLSYYAENFFNLDTFEILITLPLKQISKIRLFPKKG